MEQSHAFVGDLIQIDLNVDVVDVKGRRQRPVVPTDPLVHAVARPYFISLLVLPPLEVVV